MSVSPNRSTCYELPYWGSLLRWQFISLAMKFNKKKKSDQYVQIDSSRDINWAWAHWACKVISIYGENSVLFPV